MREFEERKEGEKEGEKGMKVREGFGMYIY